MLPSWIIEPALLLICPVTFISVTLSQPATEYQVKAAFLYNLTMFIEWPASSFSSPSDPFTLCVYGTNPFGDSLKDIVKGKVIDGRGFAVRGVSSTSQVRGCQVLFISRAERNRVADILAHVDRTGLLMVGETKGFLDKGGDINFVLESNHVRFEINARTAQKAGLKISSRLLSLATQVKQ